MLIGATVAASLLVVIACFVLPFRRGTAADECVALVSTAKLELTPAPIRRDWLIEGEPTTESAEIARSKDLTTAVYLWQTTHATYRWHHASDETVTILDGEVFLATFSKRGFGREQRLGTGDASFFPAGTITRWRVPDRLRKISTLTHPAPLPVATALFRLRALKRLIQRSLRSSGIARTLATEERS